MLEITDDIGQELSFKQYPRRIISLVPSITATFYDLQAEHLLVGRTKFCVYPTPKVHSLPIVGGTKDVHLDEIQALQPDLIICNKEENTLDIFERLQQANIPVFINDAKSLQDNSQLLYQLGEITNRVQHAKEIDQKIITGLQSIKNIFPKGKALYLIWQNPYMSIGSDTFIHEMLNHIGFENYMSKHQRYPMIELEDIKKEEPDYLLLSTEPFPFQEKHVEFFKTHLNKTKISIVRGEYFSWYGSYLLGAEDYFKELRLSNF